VTKHKSTTSRAWQVKAAVTEAERDLYLILAARMGVTLSDLIREHLCRDAVVAGLITRDEADALLRGST
jgi:hypothetical protein